MFSNKTKKPLSPEVQGRITPDPVRAEELRKKQEALQYRPETGFHRDTVQTRKQTCR